MADSGPAGSRGAPRRARPWSFLLLAASLSLPFTVAPIAARVLCDRIARSAAGALTSGAGLLLVTAAPERPEPGLALAGIGDPATVSLPWTTAVEPNAEGPSVARGVEARLQPSVPQRGRGLLIRAAVVARAVETGVRPGGVPVPASGLRPAGLALQGVSGYGAGLVDGDVLTSVGGTAATSVGAVVGAVTGAVSSGARALGAAVWRADRRIDVTVEIPRAAPAAH